MLVRATKKGYYGDRIRMPGETFNFKPATKEGEKEPAWPSWMEKVGKKSNADSQQEKADKLEALSGAVDAAKERLKDAEASVVEAENELANAKTKDEKKAASETIGVANEAVEDAVIALDIAEDALAAAESE